MITNTLLSVDTSDVEGIAVDMVKCRTYTAVDLEDVWARTDKGKRPRRGYDAEGRLSRVSGWIGPIDVNAGPGHVTFTVCPGLLLFGVNVYRVGPAQMRELTSLLADAIGIPVQAIRDATVSRLDVAANKIVARPPSAYFDLFGRSNYLRLNASYPNTRYYEQKSGGRLFRVYGKMEEVRDKGKGARVPEEVLGLNVLRFEVQVKSAKDAFDRDELTLAILADRAFWPEVVAHVERSFESVDKGGVVVPPLASGEVPKRALERKNLLAAIGLDCTGGVDQEVGRIEAAYKAKKISKAQRKAAIDMVYSIRLTPEQARLGEELRAEVEGGFRGLFEEERGRAPQPRELIVRLVVSDHDMQIERIDHAA